MSGTSHGLADVKAGPAFGGFAIAESLETLSVGTTSPGFFGFSFPTLPAASSTSQHQVCIHTDKPWRDGHAHPDVGPPPAFPVVAHVLEAVCVQKASTAAPSTSSPTASSEPATPSEPAAIFSQVGPAVSIPANVSLQMTL